MKIADQNISTGMLRQNILEKANEAFSGNKTTEDFSKKINDAFNSVVDSQNKASKITKELWTGKRNWSYKGYYATANFKYCISNDIKCKK